MTISGDNIERIILGLVPLGLAIWATIDARCARRDAQNARKQSTRARGTADRAITHTAQNRQAIADLQGAHTMLDFLVQQSIQPTEPPTSKGGES